ncbi:MAG: hypothetical protein PVF59_08140 [Desulfobacterales bacterium]|jgi:hypothetical protein
MWRFGLIGAGLLIAALSTGGPVAAAEPIEKAFAGLSWGADVREQSDFTLRHGKDNLRFYTKPGTVRTVRNLRVRKIVYGTYKYRFFAAFLIFDAPEAFAELTSYLQSRYGVPKTSYQMPGELTTHQWRQGDIKMKLKSAPEGQSIKLAFYYMPLGRQLNEERVERQQDGVRFLPIERDKRPEALPLLEF